MMLRRNGSDGSAKKLPMRTPRSTQANLAPTAGRLLLRKYLPQSVNAFYFRKIQEYLCSRSRWRELGQLSGEGEFLRRCLNFREVCELVRGVVTDRVEKDYLFGVTFQGAWTVLQKYVKVQRRMKQRNLFNRYYFGSCPPKFSMLTQPTATTLNTLKGAETNSTIELKNLAQNLQTMLQCQKQSKMVFVTRGKQQRLQKTKRKIRSPEEIIPEQNYGLRNYKKGKARSRGRRQKSKGEFLEFSKMTLCITPQPHTVGLAQSASQPRMSERKSLSEKKGSERKLGSKSGGKGGGRKKV